MDSGQAIETHDKLQLYMLNMMSDSLREQHAMAKPEEDWEPEDELVHNPNVVEWSQYGPLGMLTCGFRNRLQGYVFPSRSLIAETRDRY